VTAVAVANLVLTGQCTLCTLNLSAQLLLGSVVCADINLHPKPNDQIGAENALVVHL
jgi:hypothetical protein